MTQRDLDRSVARATGEPLAEIRHRGFSLATPRLVRHDPEPSRPPLAIDWDDFYGIEPPRFGHSRKRPKPQAA